MLKAPELSATHAVLFDVDGVLLDSLSAHLQICRDLGRRWGVPVNVPDEEGIRALARGGTKISPQSAFFRATGFSAADATRAEAHYRAHFAAEYATTLYPGVHQMLATLQLRGVPMGIVSANVMDNIVGPLGASLARFDPRCTFTADGHGSDGFQKRDAILAALQVWHLPAEQVIFVGDQLTDYAAAQATGVAFVGTSYGWAIASDGNTFPIANNLAELEAILRAANHCSDQKRTPI